MSLIIPRKEWDARPPRSTARLSWPVPVILVHHSAGAMPAEFHDGDGGDTPHDKALERSLTRGIQNFHMDSRGWSDIGYNHLIFPSGRCYQGRGPRIGAHCDGFNSSSIGICFYGNFALPGVKPTDDALDTLVKLVRYHRYEGHVPAAVIVDGHRDRDPQGTVCPGNNLYSQLDKVQKLGRGRAS